jgi:hypothetical protein
MGVTAKQEIAVPPWEVPILELVHTPGAVKIIGESRCNLRCPTPEDEYERLLGKYKHDKETLIPRVQTVYGSGAFGIEKLATQMAEALAEQQEIDAAEAAKAAAELGQPAVVDEDPQPKQEKRKRAS